jgi:hypothetical protein
MNLLFCLINQSLQRIKKYRTSGIQFYIFSR